MPDIRPPYKIYSVAQLQPEQVRGSPQAPQAALAGAQQLQGGSPKHVPASAAGPGAQTEGLGESLIPAINRLQDIFNQVTLDFKLELPQVAVIGSQSSGKSSVLEALVGRDFLPRGPEICTRRPLVLQLVKQQQPGDVASGSSGGAAAQEWGEFLHCPGKRFFNFDRIREEILAETERVSGGNKGVSDKAIRLKICSPHVLTMTLVDLPGITRVPVGDQPGDIEQRIRGMVLEYIRHPTCVILAVSAANHDLANSDALELARCADPEGRRTIGVLTKLDIMDRGTNAVGVLRNQVVPLRLGYIGVVNRSQQDIVLKRNIREARRAEANFFDSHPEYAQVVSQCGIEQLARSLNAILVDHIRAVLPSLRAAIEGALERRLAELRLYGDPLFGQDAGSSGALLLQLLDNYAVRYTEMLEGRSEALPTSELAGGARIRHIFQDIFVSGLAQLDPSSELSDEDVRTAIKNSGGVKGSLLIPDAPFELLVRRAIARLLSPSLQCKEFVHAELLRIAAQCSPPDVERFPALQRRLRTAVEDFIADGAAPTERMIRDLAACEHAYINTDHPGFIGGNRAIAVVLQRRSSSTAMHEDELPFNGHSNTQKQQHQPRNNQLPVQQEQRRPKSTGNLQDHATPSAAPTLPPQQPSRPPLTESSNRGEAKLGLKGVELELYSPEDLLGNGSRRHRNQAPASPQRPQPLQQPPQQLRALEGAGGSDDSSRGRGGWFSLPWFGAGHAPAEPGRLASPGSSSSEGDVRREALSYPPHVLRVPGSVSEQEEVQVEVTRLLVESYFDLVRRSMQDAVPKAVMHFLVCHVQRGLQQHLIRALYREELFSDMMKEREDIAAKRAACHAAVGALREAVTALEALPRDLAGRVEPVSHQQRQQQVQQPAQAQQQKVSSDQHQQQPPLRPPMYTPRLPSNLRAAHMAQTALASSGLVSPAPHELRRVESLANPFCFDTV